MAQYPVDPRTVGVVEQGQDMADIEGRLRDVGLGADNPAMIPRLRPDKGINVGKRNIVPGGTMEALRPYFAKLYEQFAKNDLGDQPHQRALGIAAKIGVGGYLGAQEQREAKNTAELKRVEDLRKERTDKASEWASGLATHRQNMRRDEANRAAKPYEPGAYVQFTPEQKKRLVARGYDIPNDGFGPRSWLDPGPKARKDSPMDRRGGYNTIIDNARQDRDISEFIIVRDMRQNGNRYAAMKSSGGDIALMRAAARITDPNTGVREEEFKTFQGAQGTLSRFGIQLTTEMWGAGKLNEYGRQQMKDILENTYQTKLSAHRAAVDFYRNQAVEMGLDPNIAVRRYEPDEKPKSDPFDAVRKKHGGK